MPGKVQQLRPDAAAPVSRPPERMKLAAAIEAHREAERYQGEVEAAYSRADDEWSACCDAEKAAEEAVIEAKEQAGTADHALAQRYMAGNPTGRDAVAEAEAALKVAQTQRTQAMRFRKAMESEREAAEKAINDLSIGTRKKVQDAVKEVVAASPALQRLLGQFDAGLAQMAAAETAAQMLNRRLGLGLDLAYLRRPLPETRPLLPDWQRAIEALEQNPDQPLPGDEEPNAAA